MKAFVLEFTNTAVTVCVDAWRSVSRDRSIQDPDRNEVVTAVLDNWMS